MRSPTWACGPGSATVSVSRDGTKYSAALPFVFYSPSFAVLGYAPTSPRGGLTSGGAVVVLSGVSLLQTPSAICRFGGNYTSPLAVMSSSSCTCVSPPAVPLTVPLEIALNGVNFTSSGLVFYYYAVNKITLDVALGPASAGATPVLVRPTFSGNISYPGAVPKVRLASGAVALVLPGVLLADPLAPQGVAVRVVTPAVTSSGFLFPINFTVEVSFNGGEQFSASATFEYYADPSVNALTPIGAPADASLGVPITVLGSNFLARPLTTFANITLASGVSILVPAVFELITSTLVVTLPALPGAAASGLALVEITLNDKRQFTTNRRTLALYVALAASPSGGAVAGNTAVQIAGLGFTPSITMTCRFGTLSVVASFASATAISCLSPPSAAASLVAVDASLDASHFSASATSRFLYFTAPTYLSLNPSAGPSASTASTSTATTISGSGFPILPSPAPMPRCQFGDAVTTASSIAPTAVVCPLPAGFGTVPVSLALNGLNWQATGLSYSFFDATSVEPTLGPSTGGTSVLVSGIGFDLLQGSSSNSSWVCRFGTSAAVPATVLSSAQLRCVSPAALAPGPVRVDVSGDGGARFTSNPSVIFLYYAAPAVSSVSPRSGTSKGSTQVTLTGQGFVQQGARSALCRFGAINPVPATVISTTQLRCSSPAGLGAVALEVSLNGIDYTANKVVFTFFHVDRIDPALGPALGGTRVTVTGSGFGDGGGGQVSCSFDGGATSTPGKVFDDLRVECASPAVSSPTTRSVATLSVSTNGGLEFEGSASSAFTFYPTPAVTSVAPISGPSAGNTTVTLRGTAFPDEPAARSKIQCLFDRVIALAAFTPPDLVTCVTPSGSGAASLTLTFNGESTDAVDAGTRFWFFKVVRISPMSGPTSGGTVVTFTGDGFAAASPYWCVLDGALETATAATYINSQSISCALPSASALASALPSALPSATALNSSAVPILPSSSRSELNLTLTSDRLSFSPVWTLSLYPAPTITAISPTELASSGGTVTLRGSGFTASSVCRFGLAVTGNTTSASDSMITCVAPPSASARNLTVYVSNNGQQFHAAAAGVLFSFTACDKGFFAAQAADACQPCPRGTYAPFVSSTTCQVCPNTGYASEEGTFECETCPAGTVSSGLPVSRENCVCRFGTFRADLGAGLECGRCPDGGVCPGGAGVASTPVPQEGFWASAGDPTSFFPCQPASACPGGDLDRCGPGRGGRMCSQCLQGWFKQGDQCLRCPKGAPVILLAFVLFSVMIAVLLIKFGGRKSAKAYSGTIGIATKFFQVLAVIGRLDVLWPDRVKEAITTVTTPFTLKMGNLAPECSAPSIAYEAKWAMTMLLPVFFALVFGLLYAGAWARARFVRKEPLSASLTNRFINGFLSLMSLGFLTLASTAIEPFGCRLEKDGSYSLVADPSRLCFAPWWRTIASFAAIGVAVYVLGIPLALFWWLRRNRDRLSNPDFVERYGGLYSSYVPGLPHWEAIVMVEKIAVAAVGLLMNGFVVLQIIFLQLIFVVTLSVYQAKTPYVRGKDNHLHALLRWCSLLVLCAGMVFKMNDFPNPTARTAIEVIALIFIVGGTAVVVASVVWNLWRIRKSLKVEISEELEKTFSLFSPHGRMVLTRWLRKATQDGLQTKLQHVLQSVKRLCDAVKPPSRDPAAKKVPRAMDYEDVPFITDDPTSDAIVATFCGGTFRDDLIPIVRTWVDQQSQSSPAQLRSFTECFSALGRFSRDQEQSKAKSTATSERLARNVTNRLTRQSSKRMSSIKKRSSSALPTSADTSPPPDLARPLTLLKTLYGPKLASYASETPALIDSAEFLMGIQAFYLVADPKANSADDRGKIGVGSSAEPPPTPSRSPPVLPGLPPPPFQDSGQVEIEMTEFGPPPSGPLPSGPLTRDPPPPPPDHLPPPPPIPPPPEL